MLKREFRLKNKYAFQATYRIKHSYYKDGVVLWVGKAKSNVDFPTKVGFVVSKKTHKRAVKRNRLKRLMRESYRLMQKEGEMGESQKYMSLIFVGFERALGNDFRTMQNTVKHLVMNVKG